MTALLISSPADVDECSHHELCACSGEELCVNLEGAYQCVCPQWASTSAPLKLNSTGKGKTGLPRRRAQGGGLAGDSPWLQHRASLCRLTHPGLLVATLALIP